MSKQKEKEIPTELDRGLLLDWLPYSLLLIVLAIVYINLTHRSDNTVRKTQKLEKDIRELRAEYITLKSEVMQKSTRSYLAEKLKDQGLKQPNRAITEIKSPQDE